MAAVVWVEGYSTVVTAADEKLLSPSLLCVHGMSVRMSFEVDQNVCRTTPDSRLRGTQEALL